MHAVDEGEQTHGVPAQKLLKAQSSQAEGAGISSRDRPSGGLSARWLPEVGQESKPDDGLCPPRLWCVVGNVVVWSRRCSARRKGAETNRNSQGKR
jgi:hypothetical protein